jgi:hypothetical protein
MEWPILNKSLAEYLAEFGYASHPNGLAQPGLSECTHVSENEMFWDVNAEAVRKDGEVPDRPIRVTVRKMFDGYSTEWSVTSVEELLPGVESDAMDRHPGTPKRDVPWSD